MFFITYNILIGHIFLSSYQGLKIDVGKKLSEARNPYNIALSLAKDFCSKKDKFKQNMKLQKDAQ